MTINNTKISVNTFFQYFFLYLMWLSHDAAWYRENTMSFRIGIIIICVIGLLFIIRRGKIQLDFFLLVVFVSTYLLVRGERNLWLNYIEYILLIYVTYNINREKFPERFVKITLFFAVISLCFFIVGLIAPGFLISKMPPNNVVWSYYGVPYHLRGRFLYCLRVMELERNNSIFTEPGLYQMFLNTSLFIMLFMRNSLNSIKPERLNIGIIIIIITIITTGSTTSMIALAMILAAFVISNRTLIRQDSVRKNIVKVTKLVLIVIAVGGVALGLDYLTNKQDSLIYKLVIKKVSEIYLEGTSGHARTSMIQMSLQIMARNPLFGAGEDYTSSYLERTDAGANGGILLHTFASIGTIPTLMILYYYFKRLFNKAVPWISAMLIIALYLNTALAQSRLLYPALLLLPIMYSYYCKTSKSVERLTSWKKY